MMTALIIPVGWYAAHCPKHPLSDISSDNASRIIRFVQIHNSTYHPRRYRRALRRFIR